MMKLCLLTCIAASLALLSCKPKPAGGQLGKTYWKLAVIEDGTKEITLSDSVRITAIFTEDNVSGNGACNRYAADFETEGVNLMISQLSSTEMACDNLNLENIYFNLFTKAFAYTAAKDQLTIFSDGGGLHYTSLSEEEVGNYNYRIGFNRLKEMFQPLEGENTPHLYPILRVDRPGNYPYTGTLIDPGNYGYFDEQTREVWTATGGEVMAVSRIGDLFIARVPGRYVSSDIALFRQQDDVLKRSETVAWAWCDEGWCNQQDAWLRDVNKDGKTDIVQHYTLTDDRGTIREERLTVLLQNEAGDFTESADAARKLNKSQFAMARI